MGTRRKGKSVIDYVLINEEIREEIQKRGYRRIQNIVLSY